MRSSRHMMSGLGLAAAMAALGGGVDFANSEPRQPRKVAVTRRVTFETGKPPTNGKREVARRLRQMQNPDCVMNHPTVAALTLVFPA